MTEREYWAKRKGQAALDKENASLAATGEPPKLTKFETDKEKLRRTIRTVLSSAISFEDFSGKLLQQGVTVKESRGRLSYLTPDRTKPVTARKLGDDFDRAAVLEALTINAQNTAINAEKPAPKQEYPRSIKDRLNDNTFWVVDRIAFLRPLSGEKPSELQAKARKAQEKPSIRAQLKAAKEGQQPKAPTKDKSQDLEV